MCACWGRGRIAKKKDKRSLVYVLTQLLTWAGWLLCLHLTPPARPGSPHTQPQPTTLLTWQWGQGLGEETGTTMLRHILPQYLSPLSPPCHNAGCHPLGNKTATTTEKKQKKLYIYISPKTSLKDPNGWNQPSTKATGNKSKSPRQGQRQAHVPAGDQQPGVRPDLPAPLALAHLWRPPAQGAPTAERGCGIAGAVPPSSSGLGRGGQGGEACVCTSTTSQPFRKEYGLFSPARGLLLSSWLPAWPYTSEPARLCAGTMTGTAPIRSSVAWLTA